MRRNAPLLLLLLCVAATGACSDRADAPTAAVPRPAAGTATGGGERVAGEYIVTLAIGADAASVMRLYGPLGVKSLEQMAPRRYLLRLRKDPGPAAVAERARGDADIESVQPNFIYRLAPPTRRLAPRGG